MGATANLRNLFDLPCTNLVHSSGTYLMTTFLRLYLRKPNRGDSSSYPAIAFRISTIPPLPRPSRSTSSRETYLRRNLGEERKYLVLQVGCLCSRTEAHHPPGSAAAVSYASLTFTSSKPFSDISLRACSSFEDQNVVSPCYQESTTAVYPNFRGKADASTLIPSLLFICRQQTRMRK